MYTNTHKQTHTNTYTRAHVRRYYTHTAKSILKDNQKNTCRTMHDVLGNSMAKTRHG